MAIVSNLLCFLAVATATDAYGGYGESLLASDANCSCVTDDHACRVAARTRA